MSVAAATATIIDYKEEALVERRVQELKTLQAAERKQKEERERKQAAERQQREDIQFAQEMLARKPLTSTGGLIVFPKRQLRLKSAVTAVSAVSSARKRKKSDPSIELSSKKQALVTAAASSPSTKQTKPRKAHARLKQGAGATEYYDADAIIHEMFPDSDS